MGLRGTGHGPGRRRWTLRRRLVAVLVGLVAVVAVAMGVASTLALQGSLVRQIDEQLAAASGRAERAPERLADFADPSQQPRTDDGGDDGRRIPPGLYLPGQSTGTVSVFAPAGSTVDDLPASAGGCSDGGLVTGIAARTLASAQDEVLAAYLSDDGQFCPLSADDTAALLALPADGSLHTVHLDGLGGYRATAVVRPDGATSVTALPTATVTSTVTRYVTVEVVVAAIALLAGAALALVLVRRELRPLDRVAATATRVARLPLDRGEVVLAERVPARDTDPSTEVGQVGAALNQLLGHVEHALSARHESESQVRRFVADASHELRTPLASIRGYTELVRRSPEELPAGARHALGRVESESLRMTALVEDLLLLARLDAGRPLESGPVDLALLALDTVADAHAAGPEHRWELDLPDEPEGAGGFAEPSTAVLCDDHRLRQVLANLTANARVHTPAGTHVAVRVRREGPSVVAQVVDDGPGIAADLRESLFQRFTRGDASRQRGTGSTGLGLAIAQAVVQAHGGTLTCSSRPGCTTFTVRLPAAGAAPAPRRTAEPSTV